ncbi:FAM72 protein-domain-containing protein [Scleroderma citrinum]
MLNYAPPPPASGPWLAHVYQNTYLPPPPQTHHKVWILDCRTCGTFLTNRGMKAVLLLRPNVSLFSTDALPANCSAYSTNPDVLRSPPYRPPSASRTCECLTQTLCCHTCGASVGYMIVVPCSRCTSPTSSNSRGTNGHRFVFHSNEVIATVRHHIPDEPGVIPVEYSLPPSSPPPLLPARQTLTRDMANAEAAHWQTAAPSSHHPLASPPSSDIYSSSSLQSPERTPSPDHSSSDLFLPPDSLIPIPRSPSIQHRQRISDFATEVSYVPREPSMRKLQAGDMVHWHQLSKTGEIPAVEEDSRARTPNWHHRARFFDR